MIGALVLARSKLKTVPVEARREALLQHIREQGLSLLPWSPELRQWQSRVMLLRSVDQDDSTEEKWPDVSDPALLETLEGWLGPYLDEITQLSHFKKLALKKILSSLLPWNKTRQLDELAPIRFEVPSGSNITIDYTQYLKIKRIKCNLTLK